MNSLRCSFLLIATATVLGFFPFQVSGQAVDRPNIVLFYVDDLGWSDLSYQGSGFYETPNIDRMARQGMRFTNAYANGPNCAPSRASLMSGQYSPRHGVYTVGDPWRGPREERRLIPAQNNTMLASEKVTIAEVLQEAGYATAHMGKWHLGEPGRAGPKAQGFDVNVGGTHAGHPPTYFSPYEISTLEDGLPGEYLTDRLTEEAVEFIDTHQQDPFFLYLSHYAVHTPLEAKEGMIEKYEDQAPWHGQSNATYAAMVESVDESMGRIVEKLKAEDVFDETIIVFTSDNGGLGGYASGGLPGSRNVTDNYPLAGGKGQLYEGGIREPMFVVWPGVVEPGTVSDEPVIGMDLYPTFVEMAGAERPDHQPLDGENLVPLLEQRKNRLDRAALYWFFPAYLQAYGRDSLRTSPGAVIRQGDHKLIWFFENDRLELYHLGDDPGEKNDLSDQQPARVRELRGKLEEWVDRLDAPLPKPNPDYEPSLK